MKNKGWIVVALAAAGAVVSIKGGCLDSATKAPDEKLAAVQATLPGFFVAWVPSLPGGTTFTSTCAPFFVPSSCIVTT